MTVPARFICMGLLLWTATIGACCTAPSPIQPMSVVVDPVPQTSSIIVRGNDFLVAFVRQEGPSISLVQLASIIHIDLASGQVRSIRLTPPTNVSVPAIPEVAHRTLPRARFPEPRHLIVAYAHDKDRLYVTTGFEVPMVVLPNDAIVRKGSLTFMLHVFDLKSATPIQEPIIIKRLELSIHGNGMHGGKPVGMKLIPGGVRTLGRDFFIGRPINSMSLNEVKPEVLVHPDNVVSSIDILLHQNGIHNSPLPREVKIAFDILYVYDKPVEGYGKTLSDGSYNKTYRFKKTNIIWITFSKNGKITNTFRRTFAAH